MRPTFSTTTRIERRKVAARVAPTLLLLIAAGASADECRTRLHPLLLDANPAPSDVAAVRALCEREAATGSPDARYQLALFHLGLAGEWQPELAIPMIREAATEGVSEAQYWLAWQYESGPLLDHDDATARGWYQRAANANHRLAIGRLAQAYDRGELGLPRDPVLAMQYRARQSQCERRSES